VDDLDTYIALLRKPKAAAGANDGGGGGAVIGRVLEFVGRRGAGAMSWQDAALQMGGLMQTLGLICRWAASCRHSPPS
jgi:hypothetical protein